MVCWGALTNFHCKLRLTKFLHPGGAGAPIAPPATPMKTVDDLTIAIVPIETRLEEKLT